MKGIFLALVCAIALNSAYGDGLEEEIAVNHLGCPIDITIQFFLPHESYCDRYYLCVVGIPTLITCPAETAFNTKNNVCDWKDHVDCGPRTFPVPGDKSEEKEETEDEVTDRPLFGYDDPSKAEEICAEKDSESILISHQDCSKYYQCSWGRPIVLSCPTNLYYNPKNGQCDWQFNVDCKNVDVDNPDWTDAERDCNKGHALVPHKFCNWFYQCGPQGPTEKVCGKGTVFDAEFQTCNWAIFVNCGDKEIRLPEEEPKETESKETDSKETEPEVPEPEVTEPEVPEPEVTEPEVTVPEVTQPEVPEPEVTVPEVTVPEVTEPEVPEPAVPLPEVIQPDTDDEDKIDDVIIEEPKED